MSGQQAPAPPRVVVLTPRQRAVLGHLTWDGAENATIAARMGLSQDTVKIHMKGVLAAFNLPSRTAVVVECLRGRVAVRVVDSRGAHLRKDAA